MFRCLNVPTFNRLAIALVLVCSLALPQPVAGQSPAPYGAGQSLPEVMEAIEKARVVTRILYVTAHPDDEPGAVLAYLARGLHADVALLSITRGEGGQNALGPEQAPQLGVIRTEELMNATRVYGTRLFLTRGADFGYTKSAEEAMKVWGEPVLADMVRAMRTFRPHVVINNWGGVRSGHGQHVAAGLLTPQAYALAADPKAFPEQLKEGLQVWKAESLLQLSRGGAAAEGFPIPVNEVSPLWGKSWGEIGVEGYLNHRTQGVGGIRSSPFFRRAITLVKVDGAEPNQVLLAAPLSALALRFPSLDEEILAWMKKVEEPLAKAASFARALDWGATTKELARAAGELKGTALDVGGQDKEVVDGVMREAGEVLRRIENALAQAAALQMEAAADRSEVVAGESFTVSVNWRKRSDAPIEIEGASLALPEGWSVTNEEKQPTGGVRFTVAIPKTTPLEPQMNADEHRSGKATDNAETQRAQRSTEKGEWIYPWPAALVKAKLKAKVGEHQFETETEVTATRVTSVGAETRTLELVPAVTLTVEPKQMVVVSRENQNSESRNQKETEREIVVRVRHYATQAEKIAVGIEAPAGWAVASPNVAKQTEERSFVPTNTIGTQDDRKRQSGVEALHSRTGDLPFGCAQGGPVAPTESREIVVRVRHYATQAEKIAVGIEAPQGWAVSANSATEAGLKDEKAKSEIRKSKIAGQQDTGAQQAAPQQSGVEPPHSKAGDLPVAPTGVEALHSQTGDLPFGCAQGGPVAPTGQDTRQTAKRITEQTVEFSGAGDQLVRFVVRPPARILPGKYELKAFAKRADGEALHHAVQGEEFRTSLEPLPTLPTRMWSEPAVARVHVMDMAVPSGLRPAPYGAGLRVGYIAAENDPIPWALQQLGVRVELLNEVELAFGDLSKYDAIAIGIRAYELRQDLARANKRLLDYAAAGGTLVVQYQREGVWNQMKPAPYPATIGSGLRTTDENSPVRLLDPKHPVLNFPNAIGPRDFEGWVQERGLYYWDKFDEKYTPILALRDPGEAEALGALVYARHGKGVYIYTGLSFFRQLPEGVAGAYRLFVNLLSQGKMTGRK